MRAEEVIKLYVGEIIKSVQVLEQLEDVPYIIEIIFESGRRLKIESTVVTNRSPDGCVYIPSFKLNR